MRNSKWRRATAAAILSVCSMAGFSMAAPQDGGLEERLRAALRTATIQLRDVQDQNAMLVAKQAEAERERLDLAQKLAADERELDALRQQVKSGQAASEQVTAQLQAEKRNAAMGEAAYRDNLMKWQAAYNEAAGTARTRDADAKKLDALLVQIRGRAQACEAKNTELYKLGNEVLDFYDSQTLFSVVGAKEPFTRLKRVEIENRMQDYGDRLRANALAHPAQ